jgi:hypothetical protein
VGATGRANNEPVSDGLDFLRSLVRHGRTPKPAAGAANSGVNEIFTIAHERLRAGCCYRCGSEIEEGLARVASVLCYDCRAATGLIGLS